MTASRALSHRPEGTPTFGIFDWIDLPPGADQADVLESRLAMIESADRGGEITTYHLAEHHATRLSLSPSPTVFLAAASQRTTRIRLATTVLVLPLYDTLRLSQEIGMLDQLSRGRIDVGLGRGSVPIEGEIYGYAPDDMTDRYDAMEPALLESLARGVYVRPSTEELHRSHVRLFATTRQKPYPPLWYPTSSPGTIPRLAQEGFNTIFGFAWFSPSAEDLAKVSDAYFAGVELARGNGGPRYAAPGRPLRFGTMRHVFVADSDARAAEIGGRALDDFNANFTFLMREHHQDLGHGKGMAPAELGFDSLRDESKVLVGSVERVTDQLVELMRVGQLNHFAGVLAFGSLTRDQVLSSLDLFQTQVVPQVGRALAAGRRSALR
ncbi:MAG: LLM class flavin-dependent oxidoreductase [Acidimicrobiales bacterium]